MYNYNKKFDFIKKNGHTCIIIFDANPDKSFSPVISGKICWCMEEPCVNIQKLNILKKRGHVCVVIFETIMNPSYPHIISEKICWCMQEPCAQLSDESLQCNDFISPEIKASNKLCDNHSDFSSDSNELKKIKKLQKKGHLCVRIKNEYPLDITWCQKEECIINPLAFSHKNNPEEIAITMNGNTIKYIIKMNSNNYTIICSDNEDEYETTVCCYWCDICKIVCNIYNPIYTNINTCDICSDCINNILNNQKMLFEPVYNFEKIKKYLNKNNCK